jgi:GNAT superfamily N-acetyltransferase
MTPQDSSGGFEPVDIQLRNGRAVTVRAIRTDDRDKLQDAIRALSPDSRYSRFFSPLRELPASLLERATNPDAEGEVQLVAVTGTRDDQTRIVAGARYAATAVSGDCEFAVAVIDDWHGIGLARRLLEMLMREARTRGFARMEGYILASNASMLGLATRLGFVRVASPEGPHVCLVRCDLGAAPPAQSKIV